MNNSIKTSPFFSVFKGVCLDIKEAFRLFLVLYFPLALILTMVFYGIFQIDEAIQRSLLEIHTMSRMTILMHISAYYAASLFLLSLVIAYLSVILVSHRQAVDALGHYEAKIHQLAYHDVLTSLPNRQLLMDRIHQSLAKTERSQLLLAVMFLDLDKFKEINDYLGHDVGDELLKIVAVRLSASVRESDTVARSGGDEFIIVLSEINQWRDASLVAEKIIERVAEPVCVQGHVLEVSASIGIAFYPGDGESAVELMKKADKAMYAAKESGRNRYQFCGSSR